MAGRKDFLSQPAPENYVAGLGRGATGFTTRSDLGPAREGPSEEQMKELLAKRAQALGAAPPTAYGATEKKDDNDDDEERFQDPENEVGLFANGSYDRDDDEADRIYQEVDEKMDRRRKMRREARERQEREEYERNNPKIQQQFADLKRSLASVSDEDWANIPEVGDLTGKNRRTKQNLRQKFYAVPDSVIAGARDSTQFETSINDDGPQTNGTNGDTTDGTMTNFADIGAARDKVLKVRLDQAAQGSGSDTVGGSATNIDPKGYLTSLTKSEVKAGKVEVGDIKRARVLLESVIKTNPRHAPGWIAAARLEEEYGKIVAARNVIARGCEFCPKSEDAWILNIQLNDNHNAKIIAANAIKNNDRSTRLWTEAMKLETDVRAKKRVLRRAIDSIPQSVAIWKEAVNLEEDPADARLLLAKATEVIPLSVELWLALARLETPEQAQKVLNKARQAVPTSYEIWIAAARLQEQMGTATKVNVMKRAVQSLTRESAMLKREEWIAEAEKCEDEGAILTCGAIIRETLGYGLDEDDDRKELWMDEAKQSINRERYETARAIYAYALRVFVNRKSIWLAAAELEKNHGTKEALFQLLQKAVEACPQSEVLWMQLAKEKWQSGEIDEARRVLFLAFKQNPNNEDIWLSAVKLEADNGQIERARELLHTARQEAGTDRVWVKSVAFERQQGNDETALDLVNQALQIFPKTDKLWMMKGQIYQTGNKLPQAREAYGTGTRACPKSIPLWLLASRLEEDANAVVRARSVLDRARLAVPKSAQLWTESVRVERRANNVAQAKVLMAKALQEVPNSGLLWSESIWHLEPRTQRKPRSLEAIKKVENDPVLFVTFARILWGERKLEKASTWFEKAIILDSDLGDTWAWYYKFLQQHGTDEEREDMVSKCVMSEPKHASIWAPAPSTTRGQPTQLSVDPKGERIAYANNKSIFLRSIDNPSISTQYTGHTAFTIVARFSPSGYYVASGDAVGTVRVWDCAGEGTTKGEYSIISGPIHDLAWDGDSQRLIAVGSGKERFGHCITADSGNTVGEISGHSSQINSVSIRQQRPLRAATGSDDTNIVFFHGAPFKFNTSLREQHDRSIYGLAFSPDGSLLVSVGADRKIWLYDGKTGEVKSQIGADGHEGSIFAVSWAKDSKSFVTSSADQTVKIWDAEAGKTTQSWRLGSEEGVISVPDHQVGVVWPSGRLDDLIISLNLVGDLTYLNKGSSKPSRIVKGHQKNVTAATISSADSSSPTLWTGGSDGRIYAWSTEDGVADAVDGQMHSNIVSSVAAAPSGDKIQSTAWDDTLRTIDAKTRVFVGGAIKTDGQPKAVALTADKRAILATHKGLELYSDSGEKLSTMPTEFSCTALAISGNTIAVGGDNEKLHFYTLSGSKLSPFQEITFSGPQITTLSFSTPVKSLLAVGFANGKITLLSAFGSEWKISHGRWSSHTGRITSIAWNKKGTHAASSSLDTAIYVWSVEKPGKRVSVMNAHKEGVNAVVWVGEEQVLSVGGDAAVKGWDVEFAS